jgi:cytochrome c
MRFDSFELSKIAGGFLCALLVIVGFRTGLEIASHGKPEEKPGYVLPLPEAAPAAGTEPAAAEPAAAAFDAKAVAEGAAAGDVAAGQKVFSKCAACHSIEPGGPNKVGPNLAGVVGRAKASHAGFNYSDAMKARASEQWTLENLAGFIHNPKGYLPGTKMLFPGIADPGDLGNLLAYLNSVK